MRSIVRQRLADCEAAKPLMHRATYWMTQNGPELTSSLGLVLLPPIALLIVGWLVAWIVRGFRAEDPHRQDSAAR